MEEGEVVKDTIIFNPKYYYKAKYYLQKSVHVRVYADWDGIAIPVLMGILKFFRILEVENFHENRRS